MASDISLAVGDGARRMTYAELAAVRGTSQASAERLVRRRGWPRQVGNDGVVRVLVHEQAAIAEIIRLRGEGKSLMANRDVMRARGFSISHQLVANTIARQAQA